MHLNLTYRHHALDVMGTVRLREIRLHAVLPPFSSQRTGRNKLNEDRHTCRIIQIPV
jgi:hypothetical protein